LIYPLAYLYIRSLLLGELKFRKNDWWLLVPAVLYAINLLPYYGMPIAQKKLLLTAIHNDNRLIARYSEGIFPAFVFSFVRVAWSALFIILNFRLTRRFKNQAAKKLLSDNKELLRWVIIVNGLLTLLLTAALVVAILAPVMKTNYIIVDLALGVSSMVICIQLFLRPKLLYGVFEPVREMKRANFAAPAKTSRQYADPVFPKIKILHTDNNGYPPISELTISAADSSRYKKIIEAFFIAQTPFLKADYTLEQLVKDTHIPRYTLSAFINREYGMGFREFLNRYRVNFFKDNLNNAAWKNLTLEAIAEECGFSNRNTFIKNFREITGQTPSEFVKTADPAVTTNTAEMQHQ